MALIPKVLDKIGITERPVSSDKIGLPSRGLDRTAASIEPLNPTQGDTLSKYFTYITKNDGVTYVLYNGDRRWTKITLTLESSGPVSVGDASNLGAVTSATGVLLQTNQPLVFTVGKGTKLYIAATAVSRVKVFIEPIPWMEQIAAFTAGVMQSMQQLVQLVATGRKS